jgi:uncharacterized protein YjbI with pentapeptide repeats
MTPPRQPCLFAVLVALPAVFGCGRAFAVIDRWDNGQPIPGTSGITLGPGVTASNLALQFADISSMDVTGANFSGSDLTSADFFAANLTRASLANATLTNADLFTSTLTGTNFSGAVVQGATLFGATRNGFIQLQLDSTASFQQHTLSTIGLDNNDLSGWDFSNQNLSNATFNQSIFTHANLMNADFSNASIQFAGFSDTTGSGFTAAQLASTTGYQNRQLQGIDFSRNDLTGWIFSGQNLSGASFASSNLLSAAFFSATLSHVNFSLADLRGATGFVADASATFTGTILPDGSVQSMQLASGQSRTLAASPLAVDVLGALTLAGTSGNWQSTLDITSNHAIIEATDATKAAMLSVLQDQVAYGRTHTAGILSSALPANTVLAIIDNGALDTPFSTFGGTVVGTDSLLLGPELLGDANADGTVDLTDLNMILNHLGTPTAAWTDGNFDGAATVDLTDLNDVLNNLGVNFAGGNAVRPAMLAPEPASLAILGGGSILLLRRKRSGA